MKQQGIGKLQIHSHLHSHCLCFRITYIFNISIFHQNL